MPLVGMTLDQKFIDLVWSVRKYDILVRPNVERTVKYHEKPLFHSSNSFYENVAT